MKQIKFYMFTNTYIILIQCHKISIYKLLGLCFCVKENNNYYLQCFLFTLNIEFSISSLATIPIAHIKKLYCIIYS